MAARADIARKCWRKIEALVDEITTATLGTERSSRGLEAARALGELGRLAVALDPPVVEREDDTAPKVIIINGGLPADPDDHEAGEGAGAPAAPPSRPLLS